MLDAQRKVAARFGVRVAAYEGGQHLRGYDDKLTALFFQAQPDPRMGAMYQKLLAAFRASGGSVFVHYYDVGALSKFGSWGARTTLHDDSAPKYRALMEYAGAPP
jgi:hypothetical protein